MYYQLTLLQLTFLICKLTFLTLKLSFLNFKLTFDNFKLKCQTFKNIFLVKNILLVLWSVKITQIMRNVYLKIDNVNLKIKNIIFKIINIWADIFYSDVKNLNLSIYYIFMFGSAKYERTSLCQGIYIYNKCIQTKINI